jgi:hypothetical protein
LQLGFLCWIELCKHGKWDRILKFLWYAILLYGLIFCWCWNFWIFATGFSLLSWIVEMCLLSEVSKEIVKPWV